MDSPTATPLGLHPPELCSESLPLRINRIALAYGSSNLDGRTSCWLQWRTAFCSANAFPYGQSHEWHFVGCV